MPRPRSRLASLSTSRSAAYVHRRIERRVREIALSSAQRWRMLWAFGGVTLIGPDSDRAKICAAPKGNWMEFVRAAGAGSTLRT